MNPVQNVIMSCSDKSGLSSFAAELVKINPSLKIFSSSGTYKELASAVRENLVEISEYTGFAEMPGGLVKTLNPKIHAGILAEGMEHEQYLKENGIEQFDMVVVNLYPFQKTMAAGGNFETIRHSIDIGGVSLIEASAKNCGRVGVVTDPADYVLVVQTLKENKGILTAEVRLRLAQKAIAHLKEYLTAIDAYYTTLHPEDI